VTQQSEAPVREHTEGLRGLRWLLTRLVADIPGLRSVAVVSADGLPLLSSEPAAPAVPRQALSPRGAVADLATVVSGLAAITDGAAQLMEAGGVRQTLVAMADGSLLVMSISDGALLGVYTDPEADPGEVAYRMALFVGRAGHLLTPARRARLRGRGERPAPPDLAGQEAGTLPVRPSAGAGTGASAGASAAPAVEGGT
jgi:predicted regulator of Ras-like GTPase activity (Roadblock/LC7/MglB family)